MERYIKDYGTMQAPCLVDLDGTFVAMIFNEGEDSGQLEPEEAEKALSLLAAAPELLKEAKHALAMLETYEVSERLTDETRGLHDAINKAEGR